MQGLLFGSILVPFCLDESRPGGHVGNLRSKNHDTIKLCANLRVRIVIKSIHRHYIYFLTFILEYGQTKILFFF